MKKTLTSTTSPSSIPDAGNEKLVTSKMMLSSSNKRIHSIHLAHQSSEATKENPTISSTLETAMQSRSAPSPDEDDHLTIKKLKTQHLQSSSSRAPTPSTPIQPIISTSPPVQVQTTIFTPPTQTLVVDLEESDDEQGLHSDVLDLLVNSFAN